MDDFSEIGESLPTIGEHESGPNGGHE